MICACLQTNCTQNFGLGLGLFLNRFKLVLVRILDTYVIAHPFPELLLEIIDVIRLIAILNIINRTLF